ANKTRVRSRATHFIAPSGTSATAATRVNPSVSSIAAPRCPSPAPREREGPIAQRWEGEGRCDRLSLTRLAALATLSRSAGEGKTSVQLETEHLGGVFA